MQLPRKTNFLTPQMTARKVLNVGGNSREIPLPPEFEGWDSFLLDIDERCDPDILCDARQLEHLQPAEFDAVYCSHNLEHYYRHDVGKVLSGFKHVLKDDGFVFIRVPDMAWLMRTVARNCLDIDDHLYDSAAGPIAVHDVIYGFGPEIERSGNDFFAHKTGYSRKSLVTILEAAGFPVVFSHCANFDVVAFAFKSPPTAYAWELLGLADYPDGGLDVRDKQSIADRHGKPLPGLESTEVAPAAPFPRLGSPRRLHIGGQVSCPGWEVLNVVPAFYVDHVGNANDLARFRDDTFVEVYASHVVEHLDYKDELMTTLKEWYRVLEPGGRVMISVPDLSVLASLVNSEDVLTVEDRFNVMRMLFGGHLDEYDRHQVGLNQEFLTKYLADAGYTKIRRVENFNLFDDTSSMEFGGVAISLNMMAEKPPRAMPGAHGANGEAMDGKGTAKGREIREAQATSTDAAIMLKTSDGISMSVPASLKCPTTHVLLEQEQWFEKELGFVARGMGGGMNALDVGAGLGAYSLPLARAVGERGRVIAFEPDSRWRRYLEASRDANGLANLTIFERAFAEEDTSGRVSEVPAGRGSAALGADARAIRRKGVPVSTLDMQRQEDQWPSLDFVRIGVAAQVERIVAGGRDFFTSESPLVMYRIDEGRRSSSSARWIFQALGYRSFRLLGDASCLVPVEADDHLDSFDRNLFAAKPDRAAGLAERDLLVDRSVAHALTEREREVALQDALSRPYARAFEFSTNDVDQCPFGDAFIAYAASQGAGLPPARRHAALQAAFAALSDYCRRTETPAGLATLVRVALDLGRREFAVGVLVRLVRINGVELDQPFFPPCERYDFLPPDGQESEWFVAAAHEQFELTRSHSSFFHGGDLDRLKWLGKSPFGSAAIRRRLVLEAIRRDHGLPDLLNYVSQEIGGANSSYWTATGLPTILAMT